LSDPLPLAVTDRLQSYLRAPAYALVPPHPGHRACFGLVRTMLQVAPGGGVVIELRDLVEAEFDKKIIECRGAACGDAAARCNRTSLACQGADGHRFTFTLGGCTAVNELFARRGAPPAAPVRDAYKEIWDFLASHQPRSDAANRLVIPRSFCVSEWAFLFARTFERFGIPVHVDEVREADLLSAQTVFLTDTCAPHMGAVGQYRRLAGEPHGMILAPQIEDLPTDGVSLGLACTVNQGGVAVACNLAKLAHPAARFHQFSVQLAHLDAAALADQLEPRLRSVFAHYGLTPTGEALRAALEGAIEDHCQLRRQAADLAADLAEEALAEGRPVAIVAGREYVLNPGLYDSSVRRLLRDKRMAAIPSYVLDVTLDAGFSHIYWRNPHAIVTILSAIADRTLHARIGHPRLAAIFRRIEQQDPPGPLVPVVQVSTFSCGPDSVTAPLVAEIMRRRPFLLLQSDAVLKELAHLENRVNTYVKQLELGLQGQLRFGDAPPIEVRRMGPREAQAPIDRDHDVVYVPTVGDNRVVTSVLRAAGITCIDNWDESLDLKDLVREGRRVTGDAVCAPLAAVYGDLLRAVEDFGRRAAAGDPLVRGKCRLLYFDNQGDGPCRQGQYAGVHELLMRQSFGASKRPGDPSSAGRLPGGAMLQLAVGRECNGFDFGLEEWALVRAYQGTVLQGVLQDLLFAGGSRCRDAEEFEQLRADHRALKDELYGELERFTGPGAIGRRVTAASRRHPLTNLAAKFFAYRLHGRDLGRPVARFARRWIHARELPTDRLRIHVSGEVYMRVAQAEPLFTRLLAIAGFGRFEMTLSPLWSYLEYLPEERIEHGRERLEALHAAAAREGRPRADAAGLARVRREVREARMMGAMLRNVIARPLYRAAGLPLPPSPRELLETAREVLPTLRPHGELALYVGEVLEELRSGVDVFLSVAPAGCMVTSMGEVLTPVLSRVAGGLGRIQSLFSADGDLNEDLLALSLLKAVGPERFSAFGHVSSRLEIAPAAAR
jgi:predicted nucleotide-binding protein (sugar kinase/HSP70/actin superfamily)